MLGHQISNFFPSQLGPTSDQKPTKGKGQGRQGLGCILFPLLFAVCPSSPSKSSPARVCLPSHSSGGDKVLLELGLSLAGFSLSEFNILGLTFSFKSLLHGYAVAPTPTAPLTWAVASLIALVDCNAKLCDIQKYGIHVYLLLGSLAI